MAIRLKFERTKASRCITVQQDIRSASWAAGSDAPELKEVKVGFIPLTDCASVVIAEAIIMAKEPST